MEGGCLPVSLSLLPPLQPISKEDRETIARLRNCIVALAERKVMLFDTSIQYTYDASLKYQVSP